jgi:hypothetical protein
MADALRQWDNEFRSAGPHPDWCKWQSIPVVRLYEAVALSLSIEPIPLSDTTVSFWESVLPSIEEKTQSAAGIVSSLGDSNTELVSLLISREETDFESRLLIAERNLGVDKNLPCIEESENVLFSMVRLADFVSWALQKNLEIAEELRDLAEPTHADDWPWGDYSTDMLKILDATVRKFWTSYTPDDQTTAPTNAKVVDWLMKTYCVSARSAGSIASIVRADGLKSGSRTTPDS